MKFANIFFNGMGSADKSINVLDLNIGDNLQPRRIENIYTEIGIDNNERIKIDFYDLATYDGEYAILPINFSFCQHFPDKDSIRLSEKIIPVFIGACIEKDYLSDKELDLLLKFQPIGCREIHTYNTMHKYGIKSYINGCITVTFPKRIENPKLAQKVFFVDALISLTKYIPKSLFKNCEIVTQHYIIDKEIVAGYGGVDKFSESQYDRYEQEARLVVTSRLHCATFCLAKGIPVVLAVPNLSYRFGWIGRFLPIYLPTEFDKIDWDPQPVDMEEEKKLMLDIAKNRIIGTKYLLQMEEFTGKYLQTNCRAFSKFDYSQNAINFIKNNWDMQKIIEYSIWGLTDTAETIYSFLLLHYPNAKLTAFYDSYKDVTFNGFFSKRPEQIIKNPGVFVFVTSDSANNSAVKMFNANNISEENYYLCKLSFIEKDFLSQDKGI